MLAPVKTERQRRGMAAESMAADFLVRLGWHVLAQNVKVGRDEVDLLAVDPGPPRTLVSVEVRSLTSPRFGAPEERVDRRKVGRLYRSLAGLGAVLESDARVGALPRRVDLVVVDRRSGVTQIRHLRALEPP